MSQVELPEDQQNRLKLIDLPSLKTIARLVEVKLGQKLTKPMARELQIRVNSAANSAGFTSLYRFKPLIEIQKDIALSYYNKLINDRSAETAINVTDDVIDVQEMLKNEVLANRTAQEAMYFNAQKSDRNATTRDSSPSLFFGPGIWGGRQVRWAYIWVDSRYRIIASIDIFDKLSFTLSPTLQTLQGTLPVLGQIRDIVSISLRKFYIPYTDTADQSYDRITLLIEELKAQSYITPDLTRHHWQFAPVYEGNRILLRPLKKTFNFSSPITVFNTMTLVFGAPVQTIIFPPDYFLLNTMVGVCGFLSLAPFTLQTLIPNTISSGDFVCFINFGESNTIFSTGIPKIDALIQRPEGYPATRLSDTIFSTNLDLHLNDIVAVLEDAISTTIGTPLITVTSVNHGLVTGDVILVDGVGADPIFSNAIANIDIARINGLQTITVVDNNTYTFNARGWDVDPVIGATPPQNANATILNTGGEITILKSIGKNPLNNAMDVSVTGGSVPVLLPPNPITVTAASSIVVISHPLHGFVSGQTVGLDRAVGLAGNIDTNFFNNTFIITVIDPNSYSIIFPNTVSPLPAINGSGGGNNVIAILVPGPIIPTVTFGPVTANLPPKVFTPTNYTRSIPALCPISTTLTDVIVTSPNHGFITGDLILLSNVVQQAMCPITGDVSLYSGFFTITVIDDNTYSYTGGPGVVTGSAGGINVMEATPDVIGTDIGSNIVRVYQRNHQLSTGDIITINGVLSNEMGDLLNGIPISEINGQNLAIMVTDANHYTITVTTMATSTGYAEVINPNLTVTIYNSLLTIVPEYQVTDITCVADVAGSLQGRFFILNTPTDYTQFGGKQPFNYYVWYDLTGTCIPPPELAQFAAQRQLLPICVLIVANDTDVAVATATTANINIVAPLYFSTMSVGAVVTVTNVLLGTTEYPNDGVNAVGGTGPTGFTFAVTTEGAGHPSMTPLMTNVVVWQPGHHYGTGDQVLIQGANAGNGLTIADLTISGIPFSNDRFPITVLNTVLPITNANTNEYFYVIAPLATSNTYMGGQLITSTPRSPIYTVNGQQLAFINQPNHGFSTGDIVKLDPTVPIIDTDLFNGVYLSFIFTLPHTIVVESPSTYYFNINPEGAPGPDIPTRTGYEDTPFVPVPPPPWLEFIQVTKQTKLPVFKTITITQPNHGFATNDLVVIGNVAQNTIQSPYFNQGTPPPPDVSCLFTSIIFGSVNVNNINTIHQITVVDLNTYTIGPLPVDLSCYTTSNNPVQTLSGVGGNFTTTKFPKLTSTQIYNKSDRILFPLKVGFLG